MVKTGRASDQFMLRLPEGLRDQIKSFADAEGRSMNAEIVQRLTDSMNQTSKLIDVQNQLEKTKQELAFARGKERNTIDLVKLLIRLLGDAERRGMTDEDIQQSLEEYALDEGQIEERNE